MKRMVKIIVTGICFGLALLLLKIIFRIDDAAFMRGYWIAAPAVVIGVLIINVCYNLFYFNKVRKIAKLLSEGKPQEYIDRIEDLLKTAKGKNLRNILELNQAAGYMETKQFDTAIPVLEKLSHERLKGAAVNVVHKINLCISYFQTSRYDEAMRIYNENQALFQQYRHHKSYGGDIAVLEVTAAVINEQYDRAEELLNCAKKMYDDPRLQKTFQEFFEILNKETAE
ncbi:MAG: hypothetical protein Q4C73_10675 [Eubacteriales bacterium]|nr:hypothetical protein [Eubacteriales bacterium]